MTGLGASAGNSLGESACAAIGSGTVRWPPSTWKFGTRVSDDRQGM